MTDARDDARLALHATDDLIFVRVLPLDQLDDGGAPQVDVLAEIHLAHGSLAQHGVEPVGGAFESVRSERRVGHGIAEYNRRKRMRSRGPAKPALPANLAENDQPGGAVAG